jgi:hypothetical protein
VLYKLGPLLRSKIPHCINVLMLNKILGNMISAAGENIDNTSRKITGFKDLESITTIEFALLTFRDIFYLIKIQSQQRILLTRNNNHRVGPGNGCSHQGHKAEERGLVRTGNPNDSHWFMNFDDSS